MKKRDRRSFSKRRRSMMVVGDRVDKVLEVLVILRKVKEEIRWKLWVCLHAETLALHVLNFN